MMQCEYLTNFSLFAKITIIMKKNLIQATSDKRQATSDKRQATSDKRQATSDKKIMKI